MDNWYKLPQSFFQNDSSLKEGAELVFAVGFVLFCRNFAGRCGHRPLRGNHNFNRTCRGRCFHLPERFYEIDICFVGCDDLGAPQTNEY